jgi:predicted GTPase
MKNYNPQSRAINNLEELKSILNEGLELGLELNYLLKKIDNVIETIESNDISIALIGSFSDGKTSTIAGMLGKLEDTMKIDTDESSDEITVYKPLGLKNGFKIIDTPGLFGTKEKELDGKDVRLSEITERYLSEAHIILYITGAVVPIKESHSSILKHILRDLNKLKSTIFIINKMDEAGIDLLDEDDFKSGSQTKQNTLVERLRQTIDLTKKEEEELNIVCIAANPKEKGLNYWFSNIDSYIQRSHINDLRKKIDNVVEECDIIDLNESMTKASITEIITNVSLNISHNIDNYNEALSLCDQLHSEIKSDLERTKTDVKESRRILLQQLSTLKSSVIRIINASSLETIEDVISEELGITDGKVSFYVFEGKIQMAISECCDANYSSIERAAVSIDKKIKMQNEFMSNALKHGLVQMKNIKIDANVIRTVRDMFFKNYKFGPWGMTNLAKNITKNLGRIAIGITIILEIFDWIGKYRKMKKFEELKDALKKCIEDYIKEITDKITNDSWYFSNLAPAYVKLTDMVCEREKEINTIKNGLDKLSKFNFRLCEWANINKINIEDIEFEEVEIEEVK